LSVLAPLAWGDPHQVLNDAFGSRAAKIRFFAATRGIQSNGVCSSDAVYATQNLK
jgi:hypothetical protein